MGIRHQLLRVLKTLAADPPDPLDLRAAVAAALPPDYPLLELTWTLFALLHYLQRRRWAAAVARERLGDVVRRLKRKEHFFVEGFVPEMSDWQFVFTSTKRYLIHRGTGERLYVSLLADGDALEDQDFYDYLANHRQPGPAEQRLDELLPGCAGLGVALSELARSGLIRYRPAADRSSPLRLGRSVAGYAHAVGTLLDKWPDARERLRLAVGIGDWPAALAAAQSLGEPALAALLAPRVEACRWRWRTLLWDGVGPGTSIRPGHLSALADAGDPHLPALLERGLVSRRLVGVSVAIIWDDPSWCPWVFDVLMREPRVAQGKEWLDLSREYVAYLARHSYRAADVLGRFARARHAPLDALIPLALDHQRGACLRLLRRGLRSSQHRHRLAAAAVLALFDAPWSRRELLAALAASDCWHATRECRFALRESRDAAAREAAARWEATHPPEDFEGVYWAAAESVMEGELWAGAFRDGMADFLDVVSRNRDYRPEAAPGQGPE
jgi:hypothetical protein